MQQDSWLKSEARALMEKITVCAMLICLLLLLTPVAVLSAVILLLQLSHIGLTLLLRKLKQGAVYLRTNILRISSKDLGEDTDEVWKSIVTNNGSVQHLDFLDDWTKDVFKTAVEIDQRWVIDLAGDRQDYICQSQSLNVFFPADVSKQELHTTHMMAWKRGVKLLYYLRSEAIKRAEKVSDEVLRQRIFESMDDEGCLACEG